MTPMEWYGLGLFIVWAGLAWCVVGGLVAFGVMVAMVVDEGRRR